MTGRHASPATRLPGEGVVRVGAALFGLGLVALVVTVVPGVLADTDSPVWLVATAAALLPLGLAVALVGLLRSARTARRAARRSSTQT